MTAVFDGRSQLHQALHVGAARLVNASAVPWRLTISISTWKTDVTYAVVARAPIAQISTRQKMGWRFRWVSSYDSDFNYDFNVSLRPSRSRPAALHHSNTHRDRGPLRRQRLLQGRIRQIFHTYSTFGRGGEFLGIYRILDVMPKGATRTGRITRSPIG